MLIGGNACGRKPDVDDRMIEQIKFFHYGANSTFAAVEFCTQLSITLAVASKPKPHLKHYAEIINVMQL